MTHGQRQQAKSPQPRGSADLISLANLLAHMAVALTLVLVPQMAIASEATAARSGVSPLASAAWVRFLGWSADGRRVAWRTGTQGQFNVPGQPCDIARLHPSGRIQDRVHVTGDVTAALVARHIHSVPLAARQQVTARDGLVQDRAGHLWAGLVRDNLAAILYKRDKAYLPLWRMALPTVALSVDLAGFENPKGDLMALVIEARMGRATAAALLVVPTSLELADAVSPTEGIQAGATP